MKKLFLFLLLSLLLTGCFMNSDKTLICYASDQASGDNVSATIEVYFDGGVATDYMIETIIKMESNEEANRIKDEYEEIGSLGEGGLYYNFSVIGNKLSMVSNASIEDLITQSSGDSDYVLSKKGIMENLTSSGWNCN